MFRAIIAAVLAAIAVSPVALASDPVAAGLLTNLTYRSNYLLFQLVANGSNSCANCPADPAGMGGGGYCWISTTQSSRIAMVLEAQAAGLLVGGRVNAMASDCTVYQMTLYPSS